MVDENNRAEDNQLGREKEWGRPRSVLEGGKERRSRFIRKEAGPLGNKGNRSGEEACAKFENGAS